MPRSKVLGAVALAALVTAVGVVSYLRRTSSKSSTELLPYQARASELSKVEQQRYAEIRASLREAERGRSVSKRWPAEFTAPGITWVQRGQGLYVNYLGVPAEPMRLRWLVLFIEPEPSAIKDPAPPEDDEHHTLSDGTALHVSVWTAPNDGPVPEVVLPFPAAEGWIQRLGEPSEL